MKKYVFAVLAFATLFCRAEPFWWVNPVGGSLNTAANWDTQRTPDTASQLVVTNGNMAIFLEDSLLVEGLYFYTTPSLELDLGGFELNCQTNFRVDCYQPGGKTLVRAFNGTFRTRDSASTFRFEIGRGSQASNSFSEVVFDNVQMYLPMVDFELGKSISAGTTTALMLTNGCRGTVRGLTIGMSSAAGSTNRAVISGTDTAVAFSSGITAGAAGRNTDLTICDGAALLLTNAVLYVGKASGSNRVSVTANASIRGGEVISGLDGGSDNLLVFDGGHYSVSDKWLQCGYNFYGKPPSSRNRILVTGTSRIECKGVSVGLSHQNCNSNEVRIVGPNAHIGTTGYFESGQYGCFNRIALESNLTAVTPSIYIGRNSGANSNTFELASGSILTNCQITLGTAGNNGNEFFINGGFYTNSTALDPCNVAPSNSLVVANGGEYVSLHSSARNRIGLDTRTACMLVVTNKGRYFTKELVVGENGTANTCLIDGGTLETSWSIMLSYNSAASGNALRVANGGLAKTLFMCLGNSGQGNTTTISNGTVWATTELRTGWNATSTNNTVRFHGTNDLLKSNGPFLTRAGTTLEFRIPEVGYVNTPIQIAGATTFTAPTTIRVDATAFGRSRGGKIPLLTSGSALASIPTLQSSVPDGCRLLLSADSKTLLLSVPFTNGTLIKLF